MSTPIPTIRPFRILSRRLLHQQQTTRQCLLPHRPFTTSPIPSHPPSSPPKTKDRGPPSKEETQTDFKAMDILSNTPPPTTAVDACMPDGFALNSGLKVTGSGVLLIAGDAFRWSPSSPNTRRTNLRNSKGQFHVDSSAWGILDLIWPKPDLLILGTGGAIAPLSVETRAYLSGLGLRVEVQDTRNAAAQYNLLATERGVQNVAGALVPVGWR